MRTRLGVTVLGAALAVCATPGLARAGLGLLKPDPSISATFVGHGGYSADGLGQAGTGGQIQAEVPAGSKVEHAWLYGSYQSAAAPPAGDFAINFDGTNVTLAKLQAISWSSGILTSARADVTQQVAAKVGAGGGQTSFAVNTDPATIDGVGLVVVYSNPKLPKTTIAVLDGAASPGGDTATFAFASPIDPTPAAFTAILSLGIGFSFQGEAGHVCGTQSHQSSLVDVNGKRLTSCAGNYDDGIAQNGGLITVGGVGDSIDNPSKPNQEPGTADASSVRDDELYNVKPFLSKGDSQLAITTANPSQNDLLFLAVISITAEAKVGIVPGSAPPPPVVGKSFNAAVVSGKVTCRAAGARAFVPLTKASQFRLGSECDATKGVIRITSASGPAKTKRLGAKTPTQTAVFFQGRFVVTQDKGRQPYTQLALSGGDFKKACAKKTRDASDAEAADPLVRKLWGKGRGHFRTKGRFSSGAVRGTYWLTEDRCSSTVTRVRQGTVVVTDNVRHKKVTVRAGHEYTAKAPGRQRKAVGSARQTSLYRSLRRWISSVL
jgi:hypothetical protein